MSNDTSYGGSRRAGTWRKIAVAFALAATALLSAACGGGGSSGSHSTTTTSSGFGY